MNVSVFEALGNPHSSVYLRPEGRGQESSTGSVRWRQNCLCRLVVWNICCLIQGKSVVEGMGRALNFAF